MEMLTILTDFSMLLPSQEPSTGLCCDSDALHILTAFSFKITFLLSCHLCPGHRVPLPVRFLPKLLCGSPSSSSMCAMCPFYKAIWTISVSIYSYLSSSRCQLLWPVLQKMMCWYCHLSSLPLMWWTVP